MRTALVLALKGFRLGDGDAGDVLPELADRQLMLRAGWLGLVVGSAIYMIGLALGHSVLEWLLQVLLGDAGGTVRIPRLFILLVYGVAVWGALIVLAGVLRILQVSLRQYAHAASFVVLPVLATALGVLGLMVSLGVWPAR